MIEKPKRFTSFVEDKIFEYRFEYVKLFNDFLQEHEKELNKQEKTELNWETELFRLPISGHNGPSTNAPRFPCLRWPKDSFSAGFEGFSEEGLEYFWRRVGETSNLVLKAAYLDILFYYVFDKKHNNASVPDKYDLGKLLVEACLRAYDAFTEDVKLARVDYLWRSRAIAAMFKDDVLLESTSIKCREYVEECRRTKDYRWMLGGIDVLLKKPNKVDKDEFRKFFGYLDDALSYYKSNPPEFLDLILHFYDYKYAVAKIVDKKLYNRIALAEDAAQFYIRAAEGYSDTSLAMQQDCYGKAAAIYKEVGLDGKAKHLISKVADIGKSEDYHKEWRKIGHNIKLSEEEVGKFREVLGVGTEVPYRMVLLFFPRWDNIVEQARDLEISAPLVSLLDHTIVGKGCYPVAISRASDEEAKAKRVLNQDISTSCGFLKFFLREKVDNGEVSFDDFDILFQKIREIDEPTYETVRVGLDLFFRGEFLAATHILVVQLEDFLRILLRIFGINPIQPSRRQAGVYENKRLYSILQELKDVLGDSLYYNLMSVLNEPIGYNLRNEVAHGTVKSCEDNELYCVILLQLYCVLLINLRREKPKK